MNAFLNRKIQITNALSGDLYRLVPLHELPPTKERLEEVRTICNEPLIYQWCFKDLCKGGPYPEELALDWFQWAKSGWEEDSHGGIMSNAVTSLIGLAKSAGFVNLFADIHPENHKSLAVIRRCKFTQTDRPPTYEGHIPYDLKLT